MMNWYGDGSGWMNGGGFVWMIFFSIVVIGLGIWIAVRNTRGK